MLEAEAAQVLRRIARKRLEMPPDPNLTAMSKAKRAHYATIASEAERAENAKLLDGFKKSQAAKLPEEWIDKTDDMGIV